MNILVQAKKRNTVATKEKTNKSRPKDQLVDYNQLNKEKDKESGLS